jgi:hypothetical protein|tara:strand:+ start:237 stop:824 length:588 start_codon:yes stop_codon:yes gene_type:complete
MASTRIRQPKDLNKKALNNQIQNRNYLAPTGFQFNVSRAPKVTYFGNQVNIPSLTLGIANQPSYLKDIPRPGEKIDFEDLTLTFLVDEDLTNYMEIQNWIRGIGFPESLDQIYDFQQDDTLTVMNKALKNQGINLYSDGSLLILNNVNLPKFKVTFDGMFPYYLSTLTFDATQSDLEYFTAQVSFKYNIYNIVTI